MLDVDTIFKKMEQQLQMHGNKQLGHAQGAVNKLFKHHLHALSKGNDGKGSAYSALESAMKDIHSMIEKATGNVFSDQLSAKQDEV